MAKVKVLDISVGDLVRDCDPRTAVRNKTVIKVEPTHVTVEGVGLSRISRARIHLDAKRRSGYLLVGRP